MLYSIVQSIQLQPIILFLLKAAIIVKDKVSAVGGFTGSRSVWFGEAQCVAFKPKAGRLWAGRACLEVRMDNGRWWVKATG